ncbi:SpvB/TcaC N-terminal domain-containing protein, partial [Streptomyces sp. NPDC056121]|uniref:SpvB/TcaC N-terminal domain-containing protein n=1 Tax=Streptomyces sp. NPDC056121 TaxID=3345718 RepID=UPI0035E0C95C
MAGAETPPAELLQLPNGGGALHGMGETFTPDLHTGTGNFAVPLGMPAGRNGFGPDLTLRYSTGQGNGPFGLGWGLGLPFIARRTAHGVPRYTADDVYCLAGDEELVPVDKPAGPAPTAQHFRPRIDSAAADVVRHTGPDDNWWEIRTKDGHVQTFGTPGHAVGDPAVLRDPRTPDHVFSWALTQTADSFGNAVEYSWRRKDGPGGASTQLLLDEVQYIDHRAADGSTRFLITISLTYGDRPDPVWDRRPGFTVRTDQRCTAITAYTHADVTLPIRAIRLEYEPARAVSLLTEVTPAGYDDDGEESQEMPAVRLGYTGFDPARRRFSKVEGAPLVGLADPALELVDAFGTALPDIVEIGGNVRYWRNRGGCRFDAPRPMPDAPGGISLSDPSVTLLDANGNGRADVMVSKPGLFGYFPLRFDGGWDRSSFQPLTSAPPFSFTDPDVRLVDLDGDGITDVVRTGENVEMWFGTPGRGWTPGSAAHGGVSTSFPSVSLADPRVRFADMTGDGLQDLVVLTEHSVAYWPSLGYGRFDSRVVMKHAPDIPVVGFDPKRLLLGDVNGDGAADLVYVDNGQVSLWLNEGGTSWSEAITVPGTPRVSANMDLRLTDLTGSGVSGVLWSGSAAPGGAAQWWFLDFTGGTKPGLLSRVDNQLGAVTEVSYASSTSMSLADQAKPETRWRTPLPFPVQVVSKVASIDALSGGLLSRAFHYQHGYWDGVEREFCGFGTVEEHDSESFEEHTARADRGKAEPVPRTVFSPPTLTRTGFHPGPLRDDGEHSEFDASPSYWPGDAHLLDHKAGVDRFLAGIPPSPERGRAVRDALRSLRGSVLRSELYELDGSARMARPHSVEEHSYGLREFKAAAGAHDPPGRRPVFRPQPTAQRTTQWERGNDPLTRFTFYDEYDDLGQANQVTQVAAPRRSRCRHPVTGTVVGTVQPDETHFLASHSRTHRATPDPGVRIHDRVAETWLYSLPQPPTAPESAPDDLAVVLRDQVRAARAIHARFHAADPATLTLMGHTVNHYDGQAFTGLPVGRAGSRGALVRRAELIATDDEFDTAYGELRPQSLDGPAPPLAGPPAALTAGHGYRRTTLPDGRRGYYADTQCRRYDFQAPGTGHGLVVASRDPLGAEKTIEFDRYGLLPVRLTDAVGLTTRITPNYRVLRPASVVDPNGNERRYRFSPTGLLREVWNRGDPSRTEGDRTRPSERYTTDLRAFERHGGPVFTHTVRQVRFDTDTTTPPGEHDAAIETREYADGFGRLIQKRATAEHEAITTEGDGLGLPGAAGTATSDALWDVHSERVVTTGRQVYDNKGRVIRVYEPCFDDGWDYSPNTAAGRPVDEIATEQFYDSRGHVVRVRRPDGSETRVIYGIPTHLSQPDAYDPTPWESYTYDANDLAPLSTSPGDAGPLTATAPATHHFTPHSMLIDAHGRSICLIRRTGPEASGHLITRTIYDLRDNVLSVTDPSGTVTFAYTYDLADHRLRVMSPDSGLRTTVLNAVGLPMEQRDAMGGALVMGYDPAGRTSQV